MIRMFATFLFTLMLFTAGPALALDPDEPLADPVLETRARALSKELRCVVCQNQSIDESDADLARAMRSLVRERLVAGASDSEILQALQDRYGDAIRLMPPFKASTYVLWAAPFVFVVFGLWAWRQLFRQERQSKATKTLEANDAEITRPSIGFVVGSLAIVLVLSGTAYVVLGNPELRDQPHRPRLAKKLGVTEQSIMDMEAMILRLNHRIETQPKDAQAWVMLGRANRYLDRQAEAVVALKRAVAAGDASATVLADLGESLVVRDGDLTPEAKGVFARALLENAAEPRAAFFMGIAAAQDGKVTAALALLRNAATQQPENSVWRRRLILQAERIANQTGK